MVILIIELENNKERRWLSVHLQRSKLNVLLLLSVLVISCCLMIHSSSSAAESQVASIEITAVVKNDLEESCYLEGETYSILKVADAIVDTSGDQIAISYDILTTYADILVKYPLDTASESNEIAILLEEYVLADDIETLDGKTNANGVVTFENLEYGLYLIMRTGCLEENEIYETDPCLVAVPLAVNDELISDVEVTSKYGVITIDSIPDEPDDPEVPDDPGEPVPDVTETIILPETGDTAAIMFWLVSAMSMLIMIWLYSKYRRNYINY